MRDLRRAASIALVILAMGLSVGLVVGRNAVATPPGENAGIVFRSNRDGNAEIYRMNVDGSNPIRLTNDPGTDARPSVSPDGAFVTFHSDRDGNFEIYVMGIDGSNPTRLTDHPAEDSFPVFSPLGNRIVFQSDRGGVPEIFSMRTDGTHIEPLIDDPAVETQSEPAVSPFGDIAYTSGSGPNAELFVQFEGSDVQTQLTDNNALDFAPDFCPGSNRLIFSTNRTGNFEIFQLDLTDPTRVANISNRPQPESEGRCSPDRRWVAWEGQTQTPGDFQIFVKGPGMSSGTAITQGPGTNGEPAWIPAFYPGGPTPTPSNITPTPAGPSCEQLEFFDIEVNGTDGGDTIDMRLSGDNIEIVVNGQTICTFLKSEIISFTINGLGGDDTITVGGGFRAIGTINGGDGNDTMQADVGGTVFSGGVGNDTMSGGDGTDYFDGGEGDDVMNGGQGNDVYTAGPGDDAIVDMEGANEIRAGTGNDSVKTGGQNDSIDAGPGNDTVRPGAGANEVQGGDGDDSVIDQLKGDEPPVISRAATDLSHDIFDGGRGNDTIKGGDSTDTVIGGPGNDILSGGSDNDVLKGGGGKDKLDGGAGRKDVCKGGPGRDTNRGGCEKFS